MSKIFVLRTYALLSSRESTMRFDDDNEIVIPLSVIDELRDLKSSSVEKIKISKELLEYLNSFPTSKLMGEGVTQRNGSILRVVAKANDEEIEIDGLSNSERKTLQVCKKLAKGSKEVVLVTNNLSLQLKAKSIGIKAESLKDEIFPKLSDQYTGRTTVYVSNDTIDRLNEYGRISCEGIHELSENKFIQNQFVVLKSEGKSSLGIVKGNGIKILKNRSYYPYGIKPKNVGQKFMIEALLDDQCPLVVIKGNAGTGKTFCTLAVGLEETIENRRYSRILVTRSVTASEQYGFLPGDIEEKLSPYLAGIKDNLSILLSSEKKSKEVKRSSDNTENGEYFFEKGIVQIQAIGFLRGRSIVDTFFIIDETQNIEPDTIKSIVTRAAEGSKFIFLGDPTQIDNPNLNERYNGLTYLSEKMKGNSMCIQVSLEEGESVRSELAKQAAQIL